MECDGLSASDKARGLLCERRCEYASDGVVRIGCARDHERVSVQVQLADYGRDCVSDRVSDCDRDRDFHLKCVRDHVSDCGHYRVNVNGHGNAPLNGDDRVNDCARHHHRVHVRGHGRDKEQLALGNTAD